MLAVEIGGREFVLSAPQGVSIAAGEAHQVRNPSLLDAEFLVVSNSPGHGDRVLAAEGV